MASLLIFVQKLGWPAIEATELIIIDFTDNISESNHREVLFVLD